MSLIHGLDALLFFVIFLGTYVIVWFENRDFYLFIVVIAAYGTEKMDDIVGVYMSF